MYTLYRMYYRNCTRNFPVVESDAAMNTHAPSVRTMYQSFFSLSKGHLFYVYKMYIKSIELYTRRVHRSTLDLVCECIELGVYKVLFFFAKKKVYFIFLQKPIT